MLKEILETRFYLVAFVLAVLAAAGILVNVPPIWRVLNAVFWIALGLFSYRRREKNSCKLLLS